MQAENTVVSEDESRYQWIERWLSTHYFYGNYDSGFVLAYHAHTNAPYTADHFRYNCPQLLADLEVLYEQGRLTRDHCECIVQGKDFSFNIYMLHDDRYKFYW